jgi:hypothetical protein
VLPSAPVPLTPPEAGGAYLGLPFSHGGPHFFEIQNPYFSIRFRRTWTRRYLEMADRTPKPSAQPTRNVTAISSMYHSACSVPTA